MVIDLDVFLDLDKDGTFETEISDYVTAATFQEGRSKRLQTLGPSRLTLYLDNQDGRFNRDRGVYSGLGLHTPIYVKARRDAESFYDQFTGFLIDFNVRPVKGSLAVFQAIDWLGLAQTIPIDLAQMNTWAETVMNRITDRMEGELIDNPVMEFGNPPDGYAGIKATETLTQRSRTTSPYPAEGDFWLEVATPGNVIGEGVEYDVTDVTDAGKFYFGSLLVHPDGISVLCSMRFWDDQQGDFGSAGYLLYAADHWELKHCQGTFDAASTSRKIKLSTNTSAQAGSFYVDCFHLVNGAKHVRHAGYHPSTLALGLSLSQQAAGAALRDVADSDFGAFLFNRSGQAYFLPKKYNRPYTASSQGEFSDNPAATYRWTDLKLQEDAHEMFSAVQIHGQGETLKVDEGTPVTVWEYENVPLIVRAMTHGRVTKIILRAEFQQANVEEPTLAITPAAAGTTHARLRNFGSHALIELWNTGFTDWTITALSITATKREKFVDKATFIERPQIDNWLLDPSFERGDNDADGISDGWEEADKDAGVNTTWSLDAGVKKFGAYSQKLVVTADADGAGRSVKLQVKDAEVIPVREGERFVVSSHINVTVLSGITLYPMVEWLDADMNHLGDQSAGTVINTTTGGWIRRDQAPLVPDATPDVVYARPYWKVGLIGTGDSLTAYFDGFQFEKADALGDYVDGDQPGCQWIESAHASQSGVIPDLLTPHILSWQTPYLPVMSIEAELAAMELASRYRADDPPRVVEMEIKGRDDNHVDKLLSMDLLDKVQVRSGSEDAHLGWATARTFFIEGITRRIEPPYIITGAYQLEEQ